MLCLIQAKLCFWPTPFHFNRVLGSSPPYPETSTPAGSSLGTAQGKHFSRAPDPTGMVWQFNSLGQDLGAASRNLSEAIRTFPFLPVPGEDLVCQLCGVTVPRAGSALAKPGLFSSLFLQSTPPRMAELKRLFFFSPWKALVAAWDSN